MTPSKIREILLRCGAEECTKSDIHRIYLNIKSFLELTGIDGVEIKSFPGSGAVCYCKIDDKILSCTGNEIKYALEFGTYFDFRTGRFCSPSNRLIELLEDTVAHLKG